MREEKSNVASKPLSGPVLQPRSEAQRQRTKKWRERGNELQFGNISGRKINSLLNAADFTAAVSRFLGAIFADCLQGISKRWAPGCVKMR